jgi:hypothetical protein
VTRDELAAVLADAYLEGDFVLRSGRRSRYYLDKYRFETQPAVLGPLGDLLAEAIAAAEPGAERLAGPELEADTADGGDRPAARAVGHVQVADGEDRRGLGHASPSGRSGTTSGRRSRWQALRRPGPAGRRIGRSGQQRSKV